MRKGRPTKAQQNKEVRVVLNRYGVDMGEVQVSCSGSRISFYGTLLKRSGEDFGFEALTNMFNELERLGLINSELTNWDLNCGVRKLERNKNFEHEYDSEYDEEYDDIA